MSETAPFCTTCGTVALIGPAADAAATPLSSGTESTPFPDQAAEQSADAGSGPRFAGLSGLRARIAIALLVVGAMMLLGVFYGMATGHSSIRYSITLADYDSVHEGLTLEQVQSSLGSGDAATRTEETSASGAVVYRWTNPDESYVEIEFVNGRARSVSQSGLTSSSHDPRKERVGGLFAVASLLLAVISFVATAVCLYVAAGLEGYRLSTKEVFGIAAFCGLLSLVPYVGPLASVLALWALIQWYTGADFIDAVILTFVSGFVRAAIMIPFGLGLGLGM